MIKKNWKIKIISIFRYALLVCAFHKSYLFFHPTKPAQLIISNFCCLDRQHKSINNTYISLLIYCSCVDLFSWVFLHTFKHTVFVFLPPPSPLKNCQHITWGDISPYLQLNQLLSFFHSFFIGPKRKKNICCKISYNLKNGIKNHTDFYTFDIYDKALVTAC